MNDYHEKFSSALFAMELIGIFLFESFLDRFLLIRSNSLAYEDYQFHLFGVSGNTNYQNRAPRRQCGTWMNKEKGSDNSSNLKLACNFTTELWGNIWFTIHTKSKMHISRMLFLLLWRNNAISHEHRLTLSGKHWYQYLGNRILLSSMNRIIGFCRSQKRKFLSVLRSPQLSLQRHLSIGYILVLCTDFLIICYHAERW